MAWFAWQSALFILLGFALGAVVGWWFWRIQWRRTAFTESEAVTVISRRHEKTVAEKDGEIASLRALLAGSAATADDEDAVVADAAAASGAGTDDAVADDDSVADAADDTDVADDTVPVATVSSDDAVVTDEPADAAGAADVTDAATDAATDGVDDAPTVVELPESEPVTAGTVVDLTDEALAAGGDEADAAGTDRDTVAHAFAQLPTQSTGEDVIDVTAAEDAAAQDASSADAPEGAPSEAADATGSGVVEQEAPVVGPQAGPADDEPAVDGPEDDLERIEGIGPRIASALRTAGIRSFRRLADADVPALQAALENAGLRFAPSLPTWSRQARFLADGDEVGFIKLTESLVAGREPGRSR